VEPEENHENIQCPGLVSNRLLTEYRLIQLVRFTDVVKGKFKDKLCHHPDEQF
jgi:hypothetical protein